MHIWLIKTMHIWLIKIMHICYLKKNNAYPRTLIQAACHIETAYLQYEVDIIVFQQNNGQKTCFGIFHERWGGGGVGQKLQLNYSKLFLLIKSCELKCKLDSKFSHSFRDIRDVPFT